MTELSNPFSPLDLTRIANLVRPFEVFTPRAVLRPAGGWMIGYGHTRTARAGAEVTRQEAEALLLYDLDHLAKAVQAAIYAPVTRNQLEALIAFAFNIGLDNFLASSTLRLLNAGDPLGAAQEIERWRRADVSGEDQVVDALVRRRAAEKVRFLTPPQGFPKASSAIMRPHFDEALALTVEAAHAAIASETPSASLAAVDAVAARLRALAPDSVAQEEVFQDAHEDLEAPPFEPPAPTALVQPSPGGARDAVRQTPPVFAPTAAEFAALTAAPAALAIHALAHGEPDPVTEPHDHRVIGPNDPFTSPEAPAVLKTPIAAAPKAGLLVENPLAPPPPFETDEPISNGYAASQPSRSFDAPAFEPLPNQTSFGLASARRDYGQTQETRRAEPSNVLWLTLGKGMLIVLALIGVALFGYSISLMLKAEPTLYSFGLGVAGVLALIPAGYALLGGPSGARDR